MNLTSQLMINALQIGAVYVIFALGLTLIFGVMGIINFAHGEFFTLAGLMIASMVPAVAVHTGLPSLAAYCLCFLIAMAAMALFGALLFKTVFVKFAGDPIGALIISLGLSMLLQSGFAWWFGTAPRRVPPLIPGTLTLLGGRITNDRLILFGLAIALTGALWLMLKKTKLGVALRAVAEDREAALLQGIDGRKYISAGFVIGTVLAALAGGLIAPTTVLTPVIGADYLTKAFIIIIIGGAGSVSGAILGGLLVGLIESFTGFYLNSTLALIMLLLLVSIILVVRPQGLMGHAKG